ncbi:deSI-like protein [Carex littledalei]|uniref:DeSI-like protein n=1 Tax=Carex littledalei TaxID=544730 RepID=A0A833VQB1_9POAL|nr:deSI-like protein [Carex littledalei]
MKFGSRKGWKSLVPFRVNKRPTTRSCLFPKVKRASQTPGYAPVYLNVYDLTPVNGYICWAGIGVFHSGVEVYGVEYAFGAHDFPSSGVFEVEPRQCPGFKFRKSILIGTTRLDPLQLRQFMELQSLNYNGDSYHLITKNCNHFCKDICFKLTGNSIPKWVNRLARIGALCNCILPGALKISAIRQDPDCVSEDSERRQLMGSFNCFSSISLSQKQPSQSSSSLLGSSRVQKSCPPVSLKLT